MSHPRVTPPYVGGRFGGPGVFGLCQSACPRQSCSHNCALCSKCHSSRRKRRDPIAVSRALSSFSFSVALCCHDWAQPTKYYWRPAVTGEQHKCCTTWSNSTFLLVVRTAVQFQTKQPQGLYWELISLYSNEFFKSKSIICVCLRKKALLVWVFSSSCWCFVLFFPFLHRHLVHMTDYNCAFVTTIKVVLELILSRIM